MNPIDCIECEPPVGAPCHLGRCRLRSAARRSRMEFHASEVYPVLRQCLVTEPERPERTFRLVDRESDDVSCVPSPRAIDVWHPATEAPWF
jgi:hypothetical protein